MSRTSVRDHNPQLLKFQDPSTVTLSTATTASVYVKELLQIPIMRFPPIPESYTFAIEILKIFWQWNLPTFTAPGCYEVGFNLCFSDPAPTEDVGAVVTGASLALDDPRVIYSHVDNFYVSAQATDDAPVTTGIMPNMHLPGTGSADLTDGRGNGVIFVGSSLWLQSFATGTQMASFWGSITPNTQNAAFQGVLEMNVLYRLKHVGMDEVIQELTGLLSL